MTASEKYREARSKRDAHRKEHGCDLDCPTNDKLSEVTDHYAVDVETSGGLTPEMKAKCKRCKHGKAAHKGACRMKHCKCGGYEP